MNKQMIATGHTDTAGKLVESATAELLADIAIANMHAANVRVCQEMGYISSDTETFLAQHAAAVNAAKNATGSEK